MRFGAVFVAICMVLIAASAGAMAYLGLGLAGTEAIIVTLSVLTVFAFHNAVSTRFGIRAEVGSQMGDLARSNAELARQVAEASRRLSAIEGRMDTVQQRARATVEPLALELGELGALVKQLADTIAAHEARLGELTNAADGSSRAVIAPEAPDVPTVLAEAAASTVSPASTGSESNTAPVDTEAVRLAEIRAAIDANRVDLYLQPVVTLPQRKVRYYEGMSRLRTESGDVVPAADFVSLAERNGLMAKIDNLAVLRCVQIVRRLQLKNREIGVFCNVCAATLADATIFQQLLDFLDANRAIAPSIILEITHNLLRSAGPIENESLSALADRGFRFSLDNLQDLRIEPRDLAARGFRFVKVPASLLLQPGDATADIHPADLSDLLGRFGIDLIAEKIESETIVVNLLDYDVRFGQGFLFSPPRPVRAEALQGVAARGEVVVREVATVEEALARPMPAVDREPRANGTGKPATTGLAQLARPATRI